MSFLSRDAISSGLLGLGWFLFGEKIGAQELEEHEAGARDAAGSPLRYSTDSYLAESGDLEASTQFVNDFVLVHAVEYRTLNRKRSSNLYLFLFRILNI